MSLAPPNCAAKSPKKLTYNCFRRSVLALESSESWSTADRVKAGHVQSAYVRDLRGVIEREEAQIGVLIGMEAPTKPMLKEAAEVGFYKPPV